MPADDLKRAQTIQAMFGRIVPTYDRLNHILSFGMDRGWRRTAAALARPDGAVVLDIGCGTGDLSAQLLRQGARQVIAADFSPEMLAVARRKLSGQGRISWLVADGLRLPFADGRFDRVTNGFLLRNLVDLPGGLQEMVRVLAPGGRLVCLEITQAPKGLLGRLSGLYFNRMLPTVGRLVSGDREAYSYLPSSVAAFPDVSALAQLLKAAGLHDVRYRRLGFGTVSVHWGEKV